MKKKIGFVGMGKLGLPVATCLGQKFSVIGYDVDPSRMSKWAYKHTEQGDWNGSSFDVLLNSTDLTFAHPSQMKDCGVIFLAVQTPHRPELEGATVLESPPENFDYSYLVQAVKDVVPYLHPEQVLVIISTCLPGTVRKHIFPLTQGKCKVIYSPLFIAMGTVVRDYTRPEFVLLGHDDKEALAVIKDLYQRFFGDAQPPMVAMSIESAELAKVAYNTAISNKVVLSSYMMELCHKVPGCDVNEVTQALKLSTDRILSPRYMDGGLPDSGPCHPRDAIAMSWLAKEIGLSYDPCGAVTKARELQTEWLADLIEEHANAN